MGAQRIWLLKTAFTGVLWMSLVLSGNAATYTVNSLADTEGSDTKITLRKAINLANEKPTSSNIDCSNLSGTIVLEKDLPPITGNVSIYGSGTANLAISGASAHRIFSVSGNITVEIYNLSLKEAYAKGGNGGNGGEAGGGGGGGMGAALFLNKGTVYCEDVNFINNKVQGGAGGGWWVFLDYFSCGGGGGFAGDGLSPSVPIAHSLAGGDGGFLGEEGRGGRSSGDLMCALDGGFGGGGGGAYGVSYYDYSTNAGNGGFGGGGGATANGGYVGSGGLFGGAGNYAGNAGGGAGLGGAIFVRKNSKLFLNHCDFTGNTALGGSSPTTTYLFKTYVGNPGQGKGGAVFAMDNAIVKVSNITFSDNTAGNASVSVTPVYYVDTPLDTNDFYGTFQEMAGDSTAFPPSAASNWPLYR